MECLQFEYKNLTFNIYLQRQEIEDIRNDPGKLENLKKTAYENYIKGNIPSEEENSNKNELKETCSSKSKIWNGDRTKLLISLRLAMEPQFTKPICKKNKLWSKISNEFNEISASNFTSLELDTKYRNLLQTYRANKIKKNKTGEDSITWDYFELFDKVLGDKASIMPQEEILGGNFVSCSSSNDEEIRIKKHKLDNSSSSVCVESSDDEAKKPRLVKTKTKENMSVNKYLSWKMKEKEKENEYKQKKWEDTKKLKEEELKIFADLVKALNKSKQDD